MLDKLQKQVSRIVGRTLNASKFLSPKVVFISVSLLFDHAWNAAVMMCWYSKFLVKCAGETTETGI